MEIVFQIFDGASDIASFLFYYDYSGVILGLKIAAIPVSIVLLYGIVYSVSGATRVLKTMHVGEAPKSIPFEKPKNIEDWKKIMERGKSADENERKLAIIAADTLIEKILALAGYAGENLGERLKKIERGDLDSLDDIWKAHLVRNRIAHEAEYKLSANDALEALARFERALKELEYI